MKILRWVLVVVVVPSERVTEVTLIRRVAVVCLKPLIMSPLRAAPPRCPVAGTEYHDFVLTPNASANPNGRRTALTRAGDSYYVLRKRPRKGE
jgi:hypothetical protein